MDFHQVLNEILFFEIEPATNCTRKCSFCYQEHMSDRYTNPVHLSMKKHNHLIDSIYQIDSMYSSPIIYCGIGEPLLNNSLLKMFKYTRKKFNNSDIILYTNGDVFTDKTYQEVSPYVNLIIYDNYDNKIGQKIYNIALSNDTRKIVCIDHVNIERKYTSRAGNVPKYKPKRIPKNGCNKFEKHIFYTASGNFVLCCNDMKNVTKKRISLKQYLQYIKTDINLSKLRRSRLDSFDLCASCELVSKKSTIYDEKYFRKKYPNILDIKELKNDS